MKLAARWNLLLAALVLAAPALAVAPGEPVKNFQLLDQMGKPHELYGLKDSKAVVLMIQGNGCPIVRQALPALQAIREQYASRGVEFLLLNSNLQDTSDTIAKEAEEFSIRLPILVDNAQTVGEELGVQRTSEVFVIDPHHWTLVYRGPMDDRLHYEQQRPATKHYLTDALDAVIAGQPVKVKQAAGVGCIVNFPNRRQ